MKGEPRLTELAHGGGCGCKLSPAVLKEILRALPSGLIAPQLLAGNENNEDAAVYQISDEQALVATTDFFAPMVDDPELFGRIAATNALSDVYAMGGRPILALALMGMPIGRLSVETIGRIVAGGVAVCATAGIGIAGGHSIDTPEPLYGLVALGLVHPRRFKRNSTAKLGDCILLTKPIGIGILATAFKKSVLSVEGYADLSRYATQLNTPGIWLGEMSTVHSMTDVTGFGLAGHLLEMSRGAGYGITINWSKVPVIEEARRLVEAGIRNGACIRNWDSYGEEVYLTEGLTEGFSLSDRDLLCDPQTSGGLLVSCPEREVEGIQRRLQEEGFEQTAVIARCVGEDVGLRVLS